MTKVFLLPLLLISLLIPACGLITPQQLLPTVLSMYSPKKVNKVGIFYSEAALIEGRTQKSYVVEMLGMPDNSLTRREYSLIRYDYDTKPSHIKARLHIVRRDGTDAELVVGNGERYSSVTVYFDTRNIIKTISIE